MENIYSNKVKNIQSDKRFIYVEGKLRNLSSASYEEFEQWISLISSHRRQLVRFTANSMESTSELSSQEKVQIFDELEKFIIEDYILTENMVLNQGFKLKH